MVAAALSGDWSDVDAETALVASGAAATTGRPTKDMFTVPEPATVTPLTLGKLVNGLTPVFGHIADFKTCHTGFANQCIRAPKSRTQYSFFHTGAVRTDEDEVVPVGRISVGGGHADLSYDFATAASHYDNASTTAAYGRATDGKLGIWFSGYAVPGREDDLLAHPPSGDWRPVAGNREMIHVLSVNSPGFPVPRAAMVASAYTGELEDGALVAAGVVMPATYVPPAEVDLDEVARRAARHVLAEQEAARRRGLAASALVAIDQAGEVSEAARRQATVQRLTRVLSPTR
jgi:hypothetical protein